MPSILLLIRQSATMSTSHAGRTYRKPCSATRSRKDEMAASRIVTGIHPGVVEQTASRCLRAMVVRSEMCDQPS